MAHWNGTNNTDNDRGTWLRQGGKAERFPSFVRSSPDLLATVSDEEPTEITTGFIRTNRAGATPTPTGARAAVRRPRPSPLFGEGEIDGAIPRYTLQDTLHAEGRQRTMWETEETQSGVQMIPAPPAVPTYDDDVPAFEAVPAFEEEDEDSITLEADPNWQARHEAPRRSDDDLELDLPAPRLRPASLEPAPLEPLLPVEFSYKPVVPLQTPPHLRAVTPMVEAPEAVAPRWLNALHHVGWFSAGALVAVGTGFAASITVLAMLIAA